MQGQTLIARLENINAISATCQDILQLDVVLGTRNATTADLQTTLEATSDTNISLKNTKPSAPLMRKTQISD